MKQWVCSVCGYVHTGDNAPEVCPQCKVPQDKFKEKVEFNKHIKRYPSYFVVQLVRHKNKQMI